MKLFIWGAGDRGGRIYRHLEPDDVIAFVDADKKKIGQKYFGKDVISVQEYMENYSNMLILIAHANESSSMHVLHENSIYNFFSLSDCPGELQEPNTREYLREYIENYLDGIERYAIYGITLYSILIDRWVYRQKGIHPILVPQAGIDQRLLGFVRDNFKELNIIEFKELKAFNIKEICGAVWQPDSDVPPEFQKGYKYTDIYDCSGENMKYRNPDIEKFKDLHNNERCFIVATGPSLCIEDLEVLNDKQEISISVNRIFHAFKNTEWRPTYYVTDDYRGIKDNSEIIEHIALKAAFVGDTYAPFWEKKRGQDIYKYHKHYEYYENRMPKFTNDFAQKSYTGLTVTYTCLQLAAYMGFKEIYLIGVDFSYTQQGGKYGHFYEEEKLTATGFGREVYLAYLSAKKYAEEHGIKIYNASRGGKLDVFERVDFDSIFN